MKRNEFFFYLGMTCLFIAWALHYYAPHHTK